MWRENKQIWIVVKKQLNSNWNLSNSELTSYWTVDMIWKRKYYSCPFLFNSKSQLFRFPLHSNLHSFCFIHMTLHVLLLFLLFDLITPSVIWTVIWYNKSNCRRKKFWNKNELFKSYSRDWHIHWDYILLSSVEEVLTVKRMFEVLFLSWKDNLYSLPSIYIFEMVQNQFKNSMRQNFPHSSHSVTHKFSSFSSALSLSLLFHCFFTFHSSFSPSLTQWVFLVLPVLGFSPEPRLFESLLLLDNIHRT